MIQRLEKLIEAVKSWPEARQDDAAAMLQAIAEQTMAEQNQGGLYKLSADECKSIDVSREQARRGDFATDVETAAVLRKHGL
jgi:hypothetical protein